MKTTSMHPDYLPGIAPVKMHPDYMLAIILPALNITLDTLKRKCRERPIVEKRQVVAYLLCNYTNLTLHEVGRYLGYDEHSSVLYASRMASDRGVREVAEMRKAVEALLPINLQTIKTFYNEKKTPQLSTACVAA